MNQPVSQPATVEVLTPEEYEAALKKAQSITIEDINDIEVKPPAMQSAPLVAKHTFSKFVALLSTMRKAYAEAPIDCTTTAGDKSARDIRLKLVTLRTRADKVRLAHNREFLEQQKANNDEYKMLLDTIQPLEQRYDDAIKAQERAAEERRLQREREERERAEAITRAIQNIALQADNLTGMSSGELAARVQEVTLIEISEDEFEHRFGEAVTMKDRTIARLEAARAEKETAERNARQVELDRQRFEQERIEREAKEAAQREARTHIERINDMLTQTGSIEDLEDNIEALEKLNIEDYQPLQDEARAAVARVLPVLRQNLADKRAAAATKAEQEAAAKVQAVRERILKMQTTLAHVVTAGSAEIRVKIAEVKDLLMADFEPLVVEAEAAQAVTLKGLEGLLRIAEVEERSNIERLAREARATEIGNRIAHLRGTAARAEATGNDSAALTLTLQILKQHTIGPDGYGERVQEANIARDEQVVLMVALIEKVKAAEAAAASAAEQAAQEAAAREAERKRIADEETMRSRRRQVLTNRAEEMFAALERVRYDDAYSMLDANLRTVIDDLADGIVAAL